MKEYLENVGADLGIQWTLDIAEKSNERVSFSIGRPVWRIVSYYNDKNENKLEAGVYRVVYHLFILVVNVLGVWNENSADLSIIELSA